MRDQRPSREEGTAGSHAVLYTVRVEDAAASRRPMRSLVAVGGVLLVVVTLGAWFRWNVEPPPSEPAWAVGSAPPAPTPAPATPAPSPTLGPLALGTPRQLLALSEPGVMATSDSAAFVGGFAAEGGGNPRASPGRCRTPFLWPVMSIEFPPAFGAALGSFAALGATPSGRLVAVGRDVECAGRALAFGDATPDGSSWGIFSDIALPWSASQQPSWLGEPPGAPGYGSQPGEVVAWVADGAGGTTYVSLDSGRAWSTTAGVRPLGWDASGSLWYVATEKAYADHRGRGMRPPMRLIGFGTEVLQREPGIVFQGTALLNTGREVVRWVLDGGGGHETAIALADSRFAANARVVAIVGGGGAALRPTVAISLDGTHFVRRLLPSDVAADATAVLGVALAPDAVLVQARDSGGAGTIVWAIPMTGVPPLAAAWPTPSPATPGPVTPPATSPATRMPAR